MRVVSIIVQMKVNSREDWMNWAGRRQARETWKISQSGEILECP